MSSELMEQVPVRLYPIEERGDDLVRIVIPRFGNHAMGRWLTRILVLSDVRLNLDEFGSVVYRSCDGNTTVGAIANALHHRFGDRAEPLEARLELFMKELFRRDLISFADHAQAPS